MKVTIKEVSGTKFEVDGVSASTSVTELKQMIEKAKGWAPSTQKLVFSGKVLQDDKILADYDWKEKEGAFLVCMITKKPAASAAAVPAAVPAATPKPAAAPVPSDPAKASQPTSTATPAARPAAQQQAPAAAPAANAFIKESDVATLKEMGFPEDQVRAALNAAFGNTDRAVEYLMTGIPAGAAEQARPAPSSGSSAPSTAGSGSFPLLRAQPQILNQLKVASRDNPQALAQVIQQLKNTHPQIIQEINANRPQFMELMREPVQETPGESGFDDDTMDTEGEGGFEDPSQTMARFLGDLQNMTPEERAHAAAAMGVNPNEMQALIQMMGSLPPAALASVFSQMQGGGGGGAGGAGGMGAPNPHQQVVHLTQQEVDAVNRLQELGFSRQACLEAYLACDKNEELAANYLFSNPPQEDDQ